MDIRSIL